MANEWTIVELYGDNNDGQPRRYAIADGLSVSVGQLLALTSPRTVGVDSPTTVVYAGVALEEHVAGKGVTTISVWTDGIFEATASKAVTIGTPLTGATENKVDNVLDTTSGASVEAVASIIGRCLNAVGSGNPTQVRLRL